MELRKSKINRAAKSSENFLFTKIRWFLNATVLSRHFLSTKKFEKNLHYGLLIAWTITINWNTRKYFESIHKLSQVDYSKVVN